VTITANKNSNIPQPKGQFDRQREVTTALYKTHGWPSSFNEAQFTHARESWETTKTAFYKANGPVYQLQVSHRNLDQWKLGVQQSEEELAKFQLDDPPKTKSRFFHTKAETEERLEYFRQKVVEETALLAQVGEEVKAIAGELERLRDEVAVLEKAAGLITPANGTGWELNVRHPWWVRAGGKITY
jgi:hypothetical protein